jgi:hypothetical protein
MVEVVRAVMPRTDHNRRLIRGVKRLGRSVLWDCIEHTINSAVHATLARATRGDVTRGHRPAPRRGLARGDMSDVNQ